METEVGEKLWRAGKNVLTLAPVTERADGMLICELCAYLW